VCLRERNIWERDMGEWDIRQRNVEETIATDGFNQQLQIHIHIRGVSAYLHFLQICHRQAMFLLCEKPLMLQRSEGMKLRSSRAWASVQGLWLWGKRRRL
jgi:hypothetical protein